MDILRIGVCYGNSAACIIKLRNAGPPLNMGLFCIAYKIFLHRARSVHLTFWIGQRPGTRPPHRPRLIDMRAHRSCIAHQLNRYTPQVFSTLDTPFCSHCAKTPCRLNLNFQIGMLTYTTTTASPVKVPHKLLVHTHNKIKPEPYNNIVYITSSASQSHHAHQVRQQRQEEGPNLWGAEARDMLRRTV